MPSLQEIWQNITEEKPNLPLSEVTTQTEGLLLGQTALRLSDKPAIRKKQLKWKTIQGIPIDWDTYAKAPTKRKNFFFVAPDQVPEVHRRQYQHYVDEPQKFQLPAEPTVTDIVNKFDQTNPKSKLDLLKQKGFDINEKANKFNITELNPFAVTEAQAAEPINLEEIWQGIKKEPSLEQIWQETIQPEKPPLIQQILPHEILKTGFEATKPYFKEGQKAMKLFAIRPDVALGLSKEIPPEQLSLVEESWGNILRKSYPDFFKYPEKLPEHLRYPTQFTKEFLANIADELLTIGTKPSTYAAWGIAERVIPKVAIGIFRKLPIKIQQALLKERYFWGKHPLDLAYKELGLKSGASIKEVVNAHREAAMKWHPDRAPAGQSIKYTREFIRKQGAFERIMKGTTIAREAEALPKVIAPEPIPTMAEAPIVAPSPIVAPTTGIPRVPSITQPSPIPLAIRLNTGRVISDPTVNLHSDIITKQGINPDDVQDVGILDEKGEYQPTKLPDEKGGAPLETLPEIPWQQNLKENKYEIKRLRKLAKKAEKTENAELLFATNRQIKLVRQYAQMKLGMPGFPKPKATYNTLIGYLKLHNIQIDPDQFLKDYGQEELNKWTGYWTIINGKRTRIGGILPPGIMTKGGVTLDTLYDDLVTSGLILEAPAGEKEMDWVKTQIENSPGKFIENTPKFEKQLDQQYKTHMEGKDVRPEDEARIDKESSEIVSNQTPEEVARIQTEPTYATQLLDKLETTRDVSEYAVIVEELDKIGQVNLTEDELVRYKELMTSKNRQFTGMPQITGEKPAGIVVSKGLEDLFGKGILQPKAEDMFAPKPLVQRVALPPYPGWLSEHYEKETWIEIWKEHPELQEQMLEYQRRVQHWRKQDEGIQYSMEPGQTPEQAYFPWEGPEMGRVTTTPSIGKTYNITDLIASKQLTEAQLIDNLKKATATFSKDIAGLQRVLLEDFADLLPPVTTPLTPLALPNIGRTGTVVNQAFIEMYNYRFNPIEHDLKRWLNNNTFAAVYRTIMRFRVATANHTDAGRVAEYKKVEKLLTVKLGRVPTIYEIANEVKWAKEPTKPPELNPQQQHTLFGTGKIQLLKNGKKGIANLLKVAQIRDLIAFGEGRVSFDAIEAKERVPAVKEEQWEKNYGDPQYSISEEDYYSVLDGKSIGVPMGPKPKVIPPVTATNESITFPKEGGRHIQDIYEREIGPVLQMSKRFRKWAGAYYGNLGKGSGLIRVKTLENLKVLSHETGHFLDDVLGKFAIPKDLRDELIAVTKYHIPFEEKYIYGSVSKRTGMPTRKQVPYTAYRRSRKELFADYVNVYITEPDKAKELAPIFTALVENEILKNKEFAYIVKKIREFNSEMQALIDDLKDARIIPEIQPDLKEWAEKETLIQNFWHGKITNKAWNWWTKHYDDFARLKWPWYGRNMTEKRGLDDISWDILRQCRHLIDGQKLRIEQLLTEPTSKFSQKDQEWMNNALKRWEILDPKVMPTVDVPPGLTNLPASEQMKFWENIATQTEGWRKELIVWGNELRKLGLLSDLVFFNNYGIYFPSFYEKYEYGRLLKASGGIPFMSKAVRINLNRLRHKLTDEEMGRKALEAQMGTWPSSKAKIEENWTKEELIALGQKIRTEILKEIKTVAYPLTKATAQMIQATYTCKALNLLANVPGIIGTRNMKGYVELPKGKGLGNLAGQWVPAHLAQEINSFNEVVSELMKVWLGVNSIFKTFKVPWAPSAIFFRNPISNIIQAWLNKFPIWRPDVGFKGIKRFATRDNVYAAVRDHGLYNHTYGSEELKVLLFMAETGGEESAIMIVCKWALKMFNTPGMAYGAIEDCFKTMIAGYVIDHGGTVAQAVKAADITLFDYSSVSKLVGGARKAMWPFITWSAKVFPQLIKAGIKTPEKYLFFYLALLVMAAMSRKALGISREEEESMKPEHLKGKPCILLPWRDENNQVQWISLTYFLPWGGWMETIKGTVVPQPLQPGNMFSVIYNAYVQNYDPFSGQIGKEWMTEEEKKHARNMYVLKGMGPNLLTSGLNNIIKGIRQAPEDYDQYGRKPLLPQILLAELTGIRITAGGETTTRVTNFVIQQKKAAVEVNRRAKLAWEAYYRNPNLITLKTAQEANEKVEPASRLRIRRSANEDIKLERDTNRRLKELSRRKRMQFKQFEEKLK